MSLRRKEGAWYTRLASVTTDWASLVAIFGHWAERMHETLPVQLFLMSTQDAGLAFRGRWGLQRRKAEWLSLTRSESSPRRAFLGCHQKALREFLMEKMYHAGQGGSKGP